MRPFLSLQIPGIVNHLDGCNGELAAFVSEASTGAFFGLLFVVDGKQAEDDGNVAVGVELGDALGHSLTDVVEVGRVATDDASEDDDAVDVAELGELCGGINEFKTAGDAFHGDVLRGYAVGLQFGDGAFEELVGDVVVPFGDNHAEAHFTGIGHGLSLVGCVGIGIGGHFF